MATATATATDQPWYLDPEALAIIAGIAVKPDTRSSRDILARPGVEHMVYVGPGVAALQRYWTRRFRQIDAIVPWPQATMDAVCMCASEQDVLAALYGSPTGHPSFPDIEARWRAIRREIEGALTERVAA